MSDRDEPAETWGTPEEWAEFSSSLRERFMPYVEAIEQWADAVAREARERFGVSEKDALARLILPKLQQTRYYVSETAAAGVVADAILAAGWRAPATSTCDHLWEWLNVKNDLATCYRCGEQEYRSP